MSSDSLDGGAPKLRPPEAKDERSTVGELMTTDPLVVEPTDSLELAIRSMLKRGVGCIPVVSGGRPVGTLTCADALEHRGRYGGVERAMNAWFLCVRAEEDARVAVALMAYEEVSHLLVVDGNGLLVGVFAAHDVLASLARAYGFVLPSYTPCWPRAMDPLRNGSR